MKKILIIGTGPSGLSVLEVLKNKKCEIDIVDGDNQSKIQLIERDNLNVSPKYNNKEFLNSQNNFIKKYLIKTKNFFLSSSINKGGGTRFWGSGLEVPDEKYYNRNGLKQKNYFKFYGKSFDFFNCKPNIINQSIKNEYVQIKKNLKEDKYLKIKSLKLAIENGYNSKYKSLDKVEGSFFNTYNKIIKLNKKNIKYKNFFVTKIIKNKKFKVFFSKNKFKNYDLIFCCAGTIGSTIIVSNILNIKSKKFRIFHNPMFLIFFLSLNPIFLIKNLLKKSKIALPGAKIVLKSSDKNHKGSIMFLSNISLNTNFIKKIIFNIAKNFLIGGNFFLDQHLSESYIQKNKKYFRIIGKNINMPVHIKRKILKYFIGKFYIPVPFLNFKPLKTGSDAHYTSTIYDFNIKKKILTKNNELINKKNFFVLDGSTIPPGLNYPTFFTVTNNFKIMSNVIKKLRV